MPSAISRYFQTLCQRFGEGWNRFWYTPSDPTSLALLRIATGLVTLWFLASYTGDLVRLFGPAGMLAPEVVSQLRGDDFVRLSYLSYLRSPAELYAAHVAALIVAAMFTAGLFSRVTSVLSLVVVLSYIHRAPMLTGLFEPILTMLLFYLCFGPTGAALSLDRLRLRRKADSQADAAPPKLYSATVSLRLVQVHLSVIYFMMAIAKLAEPGDTWWLGEAVWWLIARPESRIVDLTGLLHDHPYVLNAWSHAIVLFEFAFALLIWNRLARPLLLAISVPMWILLALVSGWSGFCLAMLLAGLAFVDPAAIRATIHRRSGASEPGPGKVPQPV